MSDERLISELLIDRDVAAFVAADWDTASRDFDPAAFTGYSGEGGTARVTFPSLDSYGRSWVSQAAAFDGVPAEALARQLHAVQHLESIDVAEGRALATKVFAGWVDLPGGERTRLDWTTYYFLRFDEPEGRWLITGFLGYLPRDRNSP